MCVLFVKPKITIDKILDQPVSIEVQPAKDKQVNLLLYHEPRFKSLSTCLNLDLHHALPPPMNSKFRGHFNTNTYTTTHVSSCIARMKMVSYDLDNLDRSRLSLA